MKIKSNKEYLELINGHHANLKESISLIGFIKSSREQPEVSEKLQHIFTYSDSNIKYFNFLTSSFLDLLCTLKGLFNSKSDWEDIYYAKTGFLTIYETINTYHFHQKDFKTFVDKDHPELLDDYKKLNSYLKNYKAKFKHETEIALIRNKTVGHFDKNFIDYYELIKKLDKNESIIAIESFMNFLKLLMTFVDIMAEKMELKTAVDLAESKKAYYDRKK
ncbi:hypothetical protein [Psychroserpens burtonensis]|uniref:hypothetical protein n=1 Tax=Psychroserpens burtonensis TaxID=49278 RepID=UPI000402C240|nr:hypothetical protein [Psychroserpens burtonensis]